jgi:hypothetical protein
MFRGEVTLRALLNSAHVNRYGGHAGNYSVAEHCIRTAWLAHWHGNTVEVQLACLIHDLHEVYPPGDVPAPIKRDPRMKSLVEMEARAQRIVELYTIGGTIPVRTRRQVDIYDRAMLSLEVDFLGLRAEAPALWDCVPRWTEFASIDLQEIFANAPAQHWYAVRDWEEKRTTNWAAMLSIMLWQYIDILSAKCRHDLQAFHASRGRMPPQIMVHQ